MTSSGYTNQIFLFVGSGLVFGALLLAISLLVQKVFSVAQKRSSISQENYECGVQQLGETNIQFDIKYYSFALLFIVFDVEFVFLLPWALYLANNNLTFLSQLFFLLEALIFVLILSLGLLYAWKKRALEWD